MENFDDLKNSHQGKPKYILSDANVYVAKNGFHYIDFFDPNNNLSHHINENVLTDEIIQYIERELQSNSNRFENQINHVRKYLKSFDGKSILDIGSGGGLFLAKLKDEGADVTGIELSDARAHYAKKKYNMEIIKRLIEDDYWLSHQSTFDAVTIWDVIEHVNYPESTLKCAVNVLRNGGYLFIDTPCRDSFFHRFGEITYKLTSGRFPTFLNSMYSAHPFGHKQIFSTTEIHQLFENAGLEVLYLKKFHELSFPYEYYLKKLLKSDILVKMTLPIVSVLLWVFQIKNKMLVIGRKK